jgi:hypothetical protein
VVTLPSHAHESFRAGTADLLEAGSIATIEVVDGDQFDCTVELATPS